MKNLETKKENIMRNIVEVTKKIQRLEAQRSKYFEDLANLETPKVPKEPQKTIVSELERQQIEEHTRQILESRFGRSASKS